MYVVLLMCTIFFVAVFGVASNPTPCYGTLLLVLASGIGCGIVAEVGDSFSALILFLIYLGGMLVVFAYSVSLSSDVYPNVLDFRFGSVVLFCCSSMMFVLVLFRFVEFPVGAEGYNLWCMFDSGYSGVSLLYSSGGGFLLIVGVGLLLTLYIVFELVRWVSFGSFKVM